MPSSSNISWSNYITHSHLLNHHLSRISANLKVIIRTCCYFIFPKNNFFSYSSSEANAAMDATAGLRPSLTSLSPRMRRLLGGGMLYVHGGYGISGHARGAICVTGAGTGQDQPPARPDATGPKRLEESALVALSDAVQWR